jgi:hypothetical protein
MFVLFAPKVNGILPNLDFGVNTVICISAQKMRVEIAAMTIMTCNKRVNVLPSIRTFMPCRAAPLGHTDIAIAHPF